MRRDTSLVRFVVVAGEASGDSLGAALINALRQRIPGASFAGVGGDRMAEERCELWDRYDAMAVMGFAEVVSRLPALLRLRKRVIRNALAASPACYIGVDAPDFNLGVERRLKAHGVTTAHYVSPSIWAWRRGRASKIAKSTDLLLTLFPFEPEIYHAVGGRAQFVGHPLADEIPMEPDRDAARRALSLDSEGPVLAVLPGSRADELRRLGELFVTAAKRLRTALPNLRFVTPIARTSMRPTLQGLIDAAGLGDAWTCIDGNAQSAMVASDAVLLASGTATLEAMLCKRPMVVSYRISPITYGVVTKFGMLNSEVFSLPNVLTETPTVPELLQDDATPDRLVEAVLPLLTDPAVAARQVDAFTTAHETLRGGGSDRAAEAITQLVTRS